MRKVSLAVVLAGFCMSAQASITTPIYLTDNPTTSIGSVTFADSKYGLLITPNLSGLTPGLHGFHIHLNPSCEDEGMAAGGHLDPDKTGKHKGPYVNTGHLGDLPALFVDQEGRATHPELAPRLNVSEIKDHALMVHEGGDNYSDNPPMGGGGKRIACGIIK